VGGKPPERGRLTSAREDVLEILEVLGAIFSRAITGNAPFLPALAAGVGLVEVHRIVARLSYGSERFGALLKRDAKKLIERTGDISVIPKR
jgi:hypothetical protein